jgi:hypothetical protein
LAAEALCPQQFADINTTVQTIMAWSLKGNQDKFLDESPDNEWAKRGYGASECTLYPCVKTFKANITAGNLTEKVVSTAYPWAFVLSTMTTLDLTCLNASERQYMRQAGYNVDTGCRLAAFPVTRYSL